MLRKYILATVKGRISTVVNFNVLQKALKMTVKYIFINSLLHHNIYLQSDLKLQK
jgi:hypothetical protein